MQLLFRKSLLLASSLFRCMRSAILMQSIGFPAPTSAGDVANNPARNIQNAKSLSGDGAGKKLTLGIKRLTSDQIYSRPPPCNRAERSQHFQSVCLYLRFNFYP